MQEYFEVSRRTHQRVWPRDPVPGDEAFASFRACRPVILSGWEMPVLRRAIARGTTTSAILADWEAVRDGIVSAEGAPRGDALVAALKSGLDDVRREWIAATPDDWLARNVPYCGLDELRRVVEQPPRALVVTTKEGEFARRILDQWKVPMAGIQGKEAGIHEGEKLREHIDGQQ